MKWRASLNGQRLSVQSWRCWSKTGTGQMCVRQLGRVGVVSDRKGLVGCPQSTANICSCKEALQVQQTVKSTKSERVFVFSCLMSRSRRSQSSFPRHFDLIQTVMPQSKGSWEKCAPWVIQVCIFTFINLFVTGHQHNWCSLTVTLMSSRGNTLAPRLTFLHFIISNIVTNESYYDKVVFKDMRQHGFSSQLVTRPHAGRASFISVESDLDSNHNLTKYLLAH